MTLSDERRQMMFAQRGNRDVLNDYHLVVPITGKRHNVFTGVFAHAGSKLRIHLSHAFGRFAQAIAIWIFANAFQNQAHALRNSSQINCGGALGFRALWFYVSDFSAHRFSLLTRPVGRSLPASNASIAAA